MKCLGLLLLLLGGCLTDVDFYAHGSAMLGTKFRANRSWYTAKHVQPDGESCGQDVVRLGPADKHGMNITLARPVLFEHVEVLLASWPGNSKSLHGIVVENDVSDGFVVLFLDARVFPGCSGSPVLDSTGWVFGVLSALNVYEPRYAFVGVFEALK